MSASPTSELRDLLDSTMASERPRVEKLTIASAIISEVLRRSDMQATLVGGGAIEFHASDIYVTNDIDLVVEGRSRDDLDASLTEFGFSRQGRHWVRGDVFVEVPGNWMSDPVDIVTVGPFQLRVVRREVVLADRIIGFKQWRATAYGAQAVALLALFGRSLDEALLLERVRAGDSEDALDSLRTLAQGDGTVSEESLTIVLGQLHAQRLPGTGGETT